MWAAFAPHGTDQGQQDNRGDMECRSRDDHSVGREGSGAQGQLQNPRDLRIGENECKHAVAGRNRGPRGQQDDR